MEPLTGLPCDVLPRAHGFVRAVAAEDPEIDEFYLGRTVDLSAARARHGADEMVPIYETSSVEHAVALEDMLIDAFFDDGKCSNEASHAGGGVSEEYVYYVYVAVWYAHDE